MRLLEQVRKLFSPRPEPPKRRTPAKKRARPLDKQRKPSANK